MKLKIKFAVFIAAAVLQACLVAQAGSNETQNVNKPMDKVQFAALATDVKGDMAPGHRFKYLNAFEREQVSSRLNDMQVLFDKFDTVQQMDQSARVRLFNDQEALNATLTRTGGATLVCTNESPLGSHIPQTGCHRYIDVGEGHDRAQQFMGTSNLSSIPR